MFKPLSSLLEGVLQKKSVRDGVRAAVVIEAARDILETLFPREILDFITPISFKDSTVVIGVRTPLVGQEVKMRTTAILKSFAERFKNNLVQRIRIVFYHPRQSEDDMIR